MLKPACDRVSDAKFSLSGPVAKYVSAVTERWLKAAPESNPAMLEMFRDRDRRPFRDFLPWSGEFAGKYLTSAVQVLRVAPDEGLRQYLQGFVDELVSLQDSDGYLGPWPPNHRLTGIAPHGKAGSTWDAWGHYFLMLGLLLWHEDYGDERALQCSQKIGDLLCDRFLGDKRPRLVDSGSTEMNLAPAHSLCLLYRVTGSPKHLDLAQQIVDEFAARTELGAPLAGDYLNCALAGKEFFEMPKPRWESLHPIMALAELHYLTGEPRYRQAFEHIWRSIRKLDRHNNGGFSSGEQAQGNPYHPGAIETCCTIAWIALTVEMLRLTADAAVGDELELSTLNSVTGLHSASGRWVTYNTPMDGRRVAFFFQHPSNRPEGSPELNCCSVNAARGFGMISDWALMKDEEGLMLNWYGPGAISTDLGGGGPVTIRQHTDYPRRGEVSIEVSLPTPQRFALKLRIPSWSAHARLRLNGEEMDGLAPGKYFPLVRTWQAGDKLELSLDLDAHYWTGERECGGKTSIYRGPLLLASEQRFNDADQSDLPTLAADSANAKEVEWERRFPPILLLDWPTTSGETLQLCDFGSAGETGAPYVSWLPVLGAKRKSPFKPT